MNPSPHSTDPDADLDFGATLRGLRPGLKVFGRHTLVKKLGQGGMGVVWLARDEKLGLDIALKFLPEHLLHDPIALDDLRRETRRSMRLTHQHIVHVYDLMEDEDGAAAIAMEYVDGQSLAALRLERAERVLNVEEITPWVRQACEALHYAHTEAQVVHRDLKPGNLMLTARGVLKVMDFGIASSIGESASRLSQPGNVSTGGTLPYMSPQQLAGAPPSAADDVYSLGATIYELLTSKPPFFRGELMHQVQTQVPPRMSERRAELQIANTAPVPEVWEQVVAACLEKESGRRPAGIAAVWELLSGQKPAISEPATSVPAVTGNRRMKMILAAAAAVVIVAVAIVLITMKKKPETVGTGASSVATGGAVQTTPPIPRVSLDPQVQPAEPTVSKVSVVSKVDSKVVKLFARIGVKVNQGDVLIKLDESVVKKAINKAKSELTTAQERLSNYKILHASGAASDEEYKSAADEVKDAEENLVQNEARIADAIVMAPVGGTIAKLNVKSGDTTKVGMVLLEIDPSSGSSESTTKTNTTALSLSTDKPAYRNGEKMRCTLRVPVDGHLRLYSIDVNGDGTQIFPNRFEPDDRVRAGSTVHVPGNQAYDFTVERPEGLTRGTEALHAVLSADSFEADDAPLPEGENFRSVGRATPEQLRLRGVRVTAKPQTWTATVNYEIAP